MLTPKNLKPTNLLSAAALAACAFSTPALAADVTVGLITKLGQSPWFINETAGARAKAQELGAKFVYQNVESDANLALTTVDTLISSGVNALAIVVPNQAIGPAVAAKAKEAGIPLVAIDDTISDSSGKPVPFVGFSAPEVGKQVGKEVAARYKALGWDKKPAETRIAVLEVQTLSVCMQRTDNATAAFLAEVPDFDKSKILHIPYETTALEPAIRAMSTVVTANPAVERWIVYSCSDEGILGPIRSLEQAGYKPDSILGVGLGGHLSCDEFKKPNETGYRAVVAFDSAKHGAAAVQALVEAVKEKKPLPPETIIPGFVADRASRNKLPGCS
jgi:L-arabinose transport system substrate-binding protein